MDYYLIGDSHLVHQIVKVCFEICDLSNHLLFLNNKVVLSPDYLLEFISHGSFDLFRAFLGLPLDIVYHIFNFVFKDLQPGKELIKLVINDLLLPFVPFLVLLQVCLEFFYSLYDILVFLCIFKELLLRDIDAFDSSCDLFIDCLFVFLLPLLTVLFNNLPYLFV